MKRNFIKVTVYVLSLFIFAGLFGGFSHSSVYAAEPTAKISFKSGSIAIQNIKADSDNNALNDEIVTKDGVKCAEFKKNYVFAFQNEFANKNFDGTVYKIEVDYFDEGSGAFRLYYDAYDEVAGEGFQNQHRYADFEDGTIYLGNTNNWKTAEFILDDAYFGKRLWTYADFGIFTRDFSSDGYVNIGSVPISEIRVTKETAKNPLKITAYTDEVGNCFEWFEDKKSIPHRVENQSKVTQSGELVFNAVSKRTGETVFTKKQSLVIEPGEVQNIDLDIGGLKTCDIYSLNVGFESDNAAMHRKTLEFSVIKTDPNGVKDDFMYVVTHTGGTGYKADEVNQQLQLVNMANFRGIRTSLNWSAYEQTKGVRKLSESQQATVDGLRRYNLKLLCTLAYNNRLYMQDGLTLPSGISESKYNVCLPITNEELGGWSKYVESISREVRDITDVYMLWNEPADIMFDWRTYNDAAAYVNLAKVTKEALLKVSKRAILTNDETDYWWTNHLGYKHLKNVIAAGLTQYADALTLHPYCFDKPEVILADGNRQEWFRDYWKQNGGSDRADVWIAEAGGAYGETRFPYNTSRGVGAYNIRFATICRAKGLTKNYCIYILTDTGTFSTVREDTFGLVRYAKENYTQYGKLMTPHEQYLMLAAYNYLMAKTTPSSVYDVDDNTKAYKFKSDKLKKDVVVLNTVDGEERINIYTGKHTLDLYDEYGNATTLYSDSGYYNLTASEIPSYLVGDLDIFDIQKGHKIRTNIELRLYHGDTEMTEIPQGFKVTDNFFIKGAFAGTHEKCSIVAAFYKDNSLVRFVKFADCAAKSDDFSEFGYKYRVDSAFEFDKVKLFIFNDLNGIKPICRVKTIK